MKLKRFLNYFIRTVSSSPEETEILFSIDGKALGVQLIEFDVAANVWRVKLK